MAVIEVGEQQIVQRCAVCGVQNEVLAERLVIDAEPAGFDLVLALPVCRCGAVEYLIRTKQEVAESARRVVSQHQVLVSALLDEIATPRSVRGGALDAALKERLGSETLQRLFPFGLRLGADPLASNPSNSTQPQEKP